MLSRLSLNQSASAAHLHPGQILAAAFFETIYIAFLPVCYYSRSLCRYCTYRTVDESTRVPTKKEPNHASRYDKAHGFCEDVATTTSLLTPKPSRICSRSPTFTDAAVLGQSQLGSTWSNIINSNNCCCPTRHNNSFATAALL